MPLKFGVLGVASIVDAFAFAAQHAPRVEFSAIASRDLAKAQAYALRHGIPRSYGSYAELLGDKELDAVYVPLPTALCAEWAVRAARKGKHVLVDKPFASTAAVEEIVRACREEGVVFMDGTHFVHSERTRSMVEVVRSGEIGDVKRIVASFSFPVRPEGNIRFDPALEPHGVIGDLGWYCIKLIYCFIGFDVPAVQTFAHPRFNAVTGSIESAACVVVFANGAELLFDVDFTCGVRMNAEVVGALGSLLVDHYVLPARQSWPFVHDRPEEVELGLEFVLRRTARRGADGTMEPVVLEREVVRVDTARPQVASMLEDFAEEVECAEASRSRDGLDRWANEAIATQRVVDALTEAAKKQ